MNQTPHGRRPRNQQALAAGSRTLRRVARLGVIAAVVALATIASTAPAFGPRVMAANGPAMRPDGTGWSAVVTPLRQSDDPSGTELTPEAGRQDDPDRMATVAAVLERQGEQSAATLAKVAVVNVTNPLPAPEPTVDVAAEQTATANAAASATAAVATEVAMSVQATVEASATSAAASQRAEARATAAASATASARATEIAAADATRAAEATPVVATATEVAGGTAAGVTTGGSSPPAIALRLLSHALATRQLPALLIAIIPMAAGLAGLVIWRGQREPFVLKAKPVRS